MESLLGSVASITDQKASRMLSREQLPDIEKLESCDQGYLDGIHPAISKKIHLVNDVC